MVTFPVERFHEQYLWVGESEWPSLAGGAAASSVEEATYTWVTHDPFCDLGVHNQLPLLLDDNCYKAAAGLPDNSLYGSLEPLVDSSLFTPSIQSEAPLGQCNRHENSAAAATSGSDSEVGNLQSARWDDENALGDTSDHERISDADFDALVSQQLELFSNVWSIEVDPVDLSSRDSPEQTQTIRDSSHFDDQLDNEQAINEWVSRIPSAQLMTVYEEILEVNGFEDQVDNVLTAAIARDHPDASCSGEHTYSEMGLNIYGAMKAKHREIEEFERQMVSATPDTWSGDDSMTFFLENSLSCEDLLMLDLRELSEAGTSGEVLHEDNNSLEMLEDTSMHPSGGSHFVQEVESYVSDNNSPHSSGSCSVVNMALETMSSIQEVDWTYEKEIITSRMLGKRSSRMLGRRSQRDRMIEEQLQQVVQDFENYWKNDVPRYGGPREERSLRSFQRAITLIMNAYCKREKRRVRYLPDFCKQVLSEWVATEGHHQNPYPEKAEIRRLAKEVGLTCTQVEQWFENYRVRDWKRHQSGIRKGKFFRYPTESTSIVKKWVVDHKDDPTPRGMDLKNLVETTSMTSEQVKQWCYNFRRRHKNELQ